MQDSTLGVLYLQHTHEDTPIEVPMAVRITLYFTKSKWTFQKHKELAQKCPVL